MSQGWIKLHRKMAEWYGHNDPERMSLWIHLLLMANHKEKTFMFNNQNVTVKPGQLITGRKILAEETGIHESKIQRLLDEFEKCHQIEQQTNNRNRLITITKYEDYQLVEQPVNSQRTAREQPVNTNNNVKNEKNVRKKKGDVFQRPTLAEVIAYCRDRKNGISAQQFLDFYDAKGWMIGKNKVKDWKACIRTWEQRRKDQPQQPQPTQYQPSTNRASDPPPVYHTTPEDQQKVADLISKTAKSMKGE